MASSNIARLGIVMGLDTAVLTADVNKAIEQFRGLKNQIKRDSEAAAKEIIALKYATEDYGKEVSKVTQVQRELDAGRYQNAPPEFRRRLLEQAAAYDQVTKSAKSLTNGLNDQQKLALTYQTTDLVTQIASGQNALIALMQQGGQLKDQMGGIGPMFTAIRMALTPMVLGITAGAVAMGVLGVAFYQGAKESADLRDQLILTGNYANLTQKTFLDLADTVSAKTNLSIGKTKDILMELAKSGKFTDQSMGSVAQAIANVAKLSGETASEVAQKLIPAFDGGADSIKSLNDKMHFLTLEQYKQIETLTKQNKLQEAAKIAADALNAKLKDQERNLGTLESAWSGITKAASWAWNAMLGIGRADDKMDRAAELERKINQMVANIEANRAILERNPAKLKEREEMLARMRAELEQLAGQITSAQDKAKAAQQETQKINDEQKFGQKRRQLAFEIDQLIVKNRYDLFRMTANDMQRIELDATEKVFLARNEMAKKNLDEGGVFAKQNAKILNEQLIAIEQDRQQKLRELAKKRYADEMADRQKLADETMNDLAQEEQRRGQIYNQLVEQSQKEKESLDYEMQKLQLKGSLIGASDHALQIAMLELETQRKIAEIMANPDLSPEKRNLLAAQARRNQGMQEMFISMQESLKATQQVYDAVFGNMERALENFVRTGKLSFKDLARSIIQDLILIQLKASATSLFRMFMGSLGFGSSSGALPSVTGQFGVGPTGFANGGNPPVGRASIVGERGPELFVPRTAGTIIPNNALSSLGGSQVVNNYNIQAIDVKSFEDRIMGSSTAVWAANAYANKSLAIGRGRA